jgi:ADP-ribose pyrophosphatase YjhB (NUDIX family)
MIRDQKVLLIKRSALEDSEPNKWCAPNETLTDNETPESAVVRGVKEELGTGFEISEFLFLHSYQGHTTHVFLGVARGEINPDPAEVADFGWFSCEEAIGLDFAYDYGKVIEKSRELAVIKS